MLRNNQRWWAPIARLLLLLVFTVAATALPQLPPDGPDITVSLYRPSDRLERAAASLIMHVGIFPQQVTSVSQLLDRSHIYVNADAIGLIYELNPELTKSEVINSTLQLRAPRFDETPEFVKSLSEGFLVRIRADQTLIDSILSSRGDIDTLIATVSKFGTERYENKDIMQSILADLSSGSEALLEVSYHLQDKDQPLNHEMLLQVRGDLEVLSTFLRQMATSNTVATKTELNRIRYATDDLRLKREGFPDTRGSEPAAMPWPMVRVVINTLDSKTGRSVPMLRIHYVPVALEGLAEQEKTFQGLSSPAERKLPEGDYVFWVTVDQDSAVLGRVKSSIRLIEDSKPLDIAVRR